MILDDDLGVQGIGWGGDPGVVRVGDPGGRSGGLGWGGGPEGGGGG